MNFGGGHDAEPRTRPLAPAIPDYELLECIGEGGYGKVFLARNSLGEYCAIKIVWRAAFSRNERPYERELDGLRLFAGISRLHEGFVDILHVGRNDTEGYLYYVMELGDRVSATEPVKRVSYIPRTLQNELDAKRQLAPAECIRIGVRLASALAFLHSRGLVHRDIKPANVIFIEGLPKLADPGLIAHDASQVSVVGTPLFMDPATHGHKLGDIYSLGRVLYVIATGLPVGQFPSLPTVSEANRAGLLELNEVFLRAGASDPAARYQTMDDLFAHLALLQAGESIRAGMRLARLCRSLKRYLVWVVALIVLCVFSVVQILTTVRQAGELREREIGSFLAHGTAALNARDYLRALPWFAAALEIERNIPAHALNHRLRIGSTLAASPQLLQMWGGTGHPFGAQFGPEGNHALFWDAKEAIVTMDIQTGNCVSRIFLGQSNLDVAILSPDGRFAFTAAGTNTACLWDAKTGRLLRVLLPAPAGEVVAAFAPDSRAIALVNDEILRTVNCASGQELRRNSQIAAGVQDLAWNPDGRLLALSSRSNGIVVWDVGSGNVIRRFTNHTSWVYGAAFSPRAPLVASASFDRTARLWGIETGEELLRLAHDGAVGGVAFSPDGTRILTTTMNNQARMFDARNGAEVLPPLPHESKVALGRFSSSGRCVLTASIDGIVRVWDLATADLRSPRNNLTTSGAGDQLAWCESSNEVVVATAASVPIRRWTIPGEFVERLRSSADGRFLLVISRPRSGGRASTRGATLWDAAKGFPAGPRLRLPAPAAQSALSPDGRMLAAVAGEKLLVWNTISGDLMAQTQLPNPDVSCLVWHPSSARLALGMGDLANIFDVGLGRFLWPAPVRQSMAVATVCFSPNGRLLATATADMTVNPGEARIWDVEDGTPRNVVLRHKDGVRDVAFSADGRWLATASEDFTAAVWESATGRMVGQPLRHGDEVTSVAFASAHSWLVAGCRDGTSRVWDLETSEPLTPPIQFGGRLKKVRFANDDRALLVESVDGRAWLWELPFDERPVPELRVLGRILSAESSGPMTDSAAEGTQSLTEAFAHLRFPYFRNPLMPVNASPVDESKPANEYNN